MSSARKADRPAYRADVDGLRAVAVLLVMADHFGIRLRGGYIGVDVFFVISGYLISGIILSEMAEGRFSLVRFYERRVRRIFPALLVMIALVTVAVYRLFLPSEVEAYGRSVLAAIGSVSNFLFWHEAGYFDEASTIKPLLHTWSLAVEEQFYVLFPLLLVVVRRWWPQRLKAAILGIAGLSFVAAVVTVHNSPTAAFFFAPLRAWELLLGTMISQRYLPEIRGAVARNAASALGLLLLVVPALNYTSRTAFPGLAALPACAGAALIILAGETSAAGESGSSVVGRMLAWRPVVFVGLISYSVYLWHWPVLVFERTSSVLPLDLDRTRDKFLLLALSLVLGWISWALVEQPIRTGRLRPGRRAVFWVNGLAAAAVSVVALVFMGAHGFPQRFPPDARAIAAYEDYYKPEFFREGSCFLVPGMSLSTFNQAACLTARPGHPTILLAGDSHIADQWYGLAQIFPEDTFLQVTSSGCHPLLVGSAAAKSPVCEQMNALLFDHYLPHHPVDLLVLGARWDKSDLAPLGRTIEHLQQQGVKVMVVGPGVEYDTPLPRMLAVGLRDGRVVQSGPHLVSYLRPLDEQMAALARTRWHVAYVSVFQDLCRPDCPLYAQPGVPLLFDSNHFTQAGSVLMAQRMREGGELR